MGVGDLTTAAHATLDHTGIPGIPSVTLVKRQLAKSSSVSGNVGAATIQSPTATPTTGTGTQVLSFAYTPIRVGNLVKVTAQILTGSGTARDVIGSVFQGSVCIGGSADRSQGGGSGFLTLIVLGEFTVSSLSPVTISSRVALDAIQGNFYINGTNGGTSALFAAPTSFLVAEEYDPT